MKRVHPKSFICVVCKEEFKNIYSDTLRIFCSRNCYWESEEMSVKSRETQEKRIEQGTHNLYEGGISSKHELLRRGAKYKKWRLSVFDRDKYTCQECGQHGGELHADHIKAFAFFPRLRFVVNNGRTSCVKCHKDTPNYGYKAKLLSQSQSIHT